MTVEFVTNDDLKSYFGEDHVNALVNNAGIDVDTVCLSANDLVYSYVITQAGSADFKISSALKRAAADIAHYNLFENNAPEVVLKKYEDALAYIEKIAKSIIRLQLNDDPSTTTDESKLTLSRASVQINREDETSPNKIIGW